MILQNEDHDDKDDLWPALNLTLNLLHQVITVLAEGALYDGKEGIRYPHEKVHDKGKIGGHREPKVFHRLEVSPVCAAQPGQNWKWKTYTIHGVVRQPDSQWVTHHITTVTKFLTWVSSVGETTLPPPVQVPQILEYQHVQIPVWQWICIPCLDVSSWVIITDLQTKALQDVLE
ncbi:hypothetical protein EDC04DRAFT_2613139 [Pisolithus marmoratus]|nr:hypothetical protein EDC04DRAFT_2613139 [Pisolithus marmoratus]